MEISTTRLSLRRLTPNDVTDAYVGWLNDPDVYRFLETRLSVQNKKSVLDFVAEKAASDNEFLFGMFLRDSGRHIGNIKVGPIHRHHKVADVSLLIGERDCWGKGYAAEAITAVSRHAFEKLGVAKLSAGMYVANEGSRRAFLKAGYRQEGLRRAHYESEDGRTDLVEVGALPGEIT
ncbi:MAG: GNAT family N-acetyltransferase [Rhizobiaceae bacterium]|nr:GNAT family N-acetyltransferase [Rhizobiaceae bacterium]